MRSGPAATAGLLLALALISSGCGEEQSAATETAAERTAIKTTRGATSAPAASTKRPPAADDLVAQRRCRRTLGEFLDAMESLGNAVAVGLDYHGYLTMVNRVRATYAEVDADRLPLLCLARAAAPAEAALNSYIAAANAWGECLAATSCELSEVEPRLQRSWARASDLLAAASATLGKGLS